ncbi:hypothetical protein [Flavobacterium restrictum]|uniref:hypothetical protein n=1 Tax=Flavobacterium restrictum TaxID=2594428 RepID=UPI001F39F824|nr:hypothetical protein [Flavobacterium restrictum]
MPYINKIPALTTFPVRQAVLREGKPLDTCYFDGDNLGTTTHFGIFLEDNLVGILSVYKKITLYLPRKIKCKFGVWQF